MYRKRESRFAAARGDNLAECLDIVCNQSARAFEIVRAGMTLRDDPTLRFGQFANIVDLVRRRLSAAPDIGGNRRSRKSNITQLDCADETPNSD
ncbi:MAG: hypothetical protein WAV02_00145 [Stellaceae bacterium]